MHNPHKPQILHWSQRKPLFNGFRETLILVLAACITLKPIRIASWDLFNKYIAYDGDRRKTPSFTSKSWTEKQTNLKS
jgi:hypothetical protein